MRKYDLLDISFSNGGLFTSDGEWIHSERTIDSNELIVVVSGEIFIEENGKQMPLSKGDYCILRKGLNHKGYKKSTNFVSFYWLHFYSEDLSIPTLGKITNLSVVIQEIKHLLQISATENYLPKTKDCAFYVILSELFFQNYNCSSDNSLASSVFEYIRSHSNEILTAKKISEHFNYNPNYLSRILKKSYGKNLKKCIIESRINSAKFLLSTTNHSLTKISEMLGYNDTNLFIKFYIYNTGSTPLKYRNSFINQHTNHL